VLRAVRVESATKVVAIVDEQTDEEVVAIVEE
jgi:hypothetical protein